MCPCSGTPSLAVLPSSSENRVDKASFLLQQTFFDRKREGKKEKVEARRKEEEGYERHFLENIPSEHLSAPAAEAGGAVGQVD